MSINTPKRSHSLIHHKNYLHSRTNTPPQEESPVLKHLTPPLSHSPVPTPQRSSSINQQHSTRLTRSSSLSHLHRKTPTRSNSLPQKPHCSKDYHTPLPPIPPFLLEEPEEQLKIIPPTRSTSLLRQPRKIIKNQPDEDITKALLEWKHKSVFKVDWANMFSPSVELWKMSDNIFGSVEDLLNYKNDAANLDVEKASGALWLEDESFVPKKEIAAYLGKLDPFCHRVLKRYMDFFDFTGMKLVEAFRKLCSKLYFKAEAQEIDRILEVFSYKYWNSNLDGNVYYKNADVVYTITYSIMLLNTDLHLVQISSHAKMTSDLFCENTMSTVMEQKLIIEGENNPDLESWKGQLESNLRDIYASVKSNGILQPVSEEAPKSFLKRMGSMTQRKKRINSSSSDV